MAKDNREVHIKLRQGAVLRQAKGGARGAPTVGTLAVTITNPTRPDPPFLFEEFGGSGPDHVYRLAEIKLRAWLDENGWPEYRATLTLELGLRRQKKKH